MNDFDVAPGVRALRDAAGLWTAAPQDRGHAKALILAAAQALAAGIDTPSLRDVAGTSTQGNLPWPFPGMVLSMSEELGLALPEPGSDEAQVVAVEALCRQLLSGLVAPREVAEWAHRYVGHEGALVLQEFVMLDDEYDMCGDSPEEVQRQLDQRVRTAAEALMRPRPVQ